MFEGAAIIQPGMSGAPSDLTTSVATLCAGEFGQGWLVSVGIVFSRLGGLKCTRNCALSLLEIFVPRSAVSYTTDVDVGETGLPTARLVKC